MSTLPFLHFFTRNFFNCFGNYLSLALQYSALCVPDEVNPKKRQGCMKFIHCCFHFYSTGSIPLLVDDQSPRVSFVSSIIHKKLLLNCPFRNHKGTKISTSSGKDYLRLFGLLYLRSVVIIQLCNCFSSYAFLVFKCYTLSVLEESTSE